MITRGWRDLMEELGDDRGAPESIRLSWCDKSRTSWARYWKIKSRTERQSTGRTEE